MNENKVVSLRQKDEIDDPLTDILRAGAKRRKNVAHGASRGMLRAAPDIQKPRQGR